MLLSQKLSTAPLLLGFVLLYLALDWVSFIHPMRGFTITPWNPQSALLVALLWWRPSAWWLVVACLVAGQAMLRGMAQPWAAELAACSLLTLGYWMTAAALRRWVGLGAPAASRALMFVAVAVAGALVGAVLYVFGLALFGVAQMDRVVPAILRAWVGDAVSFLVTLPLLLVAADAELRRSARAVLGTLEAWLIALAAVVCGYWVFLHTTEEQFKLFYLMFVPVVWSAARFGLAGAIFSAALVQLLLVGAVQSTAYRPLTVFELQMLMAVLASTGLLLGATVDEREATAAALRDSLRLAAAGDTAAALAHELNQPLTAMSTYARVCQLLARRAGEETQLSDVADKLVNEANRASDVVKRLRDFFRDRTTDLQLTDLGPLVRAVVDDQKARAESVQVELRCRCEPGLPALWFDRTQIEVVLRNLLSNAVDAALQSPQAQARVDVSVVHDGGSVTVAVLDSGLGIPSAELQSIFESRSSSKPGGMGIGLSISRSIVQAHGGRLWAQAGPGGRFFLSLPVQPPHTP